MGPVRSINEPKPSSGYLGTYLDSRLVQLVRTRLFHFLSLSTHFVSNSSFFTRL